MKASNPCELIKNKRAYYERMETDFEFRMNEIDKKLKTVNALTGFNKYMRYKATVIEHDVLGGYVDTFEIGLHGEVKKY